MMRLKASAKYLNATAALKIKNALGQFNHDYFFTVNIRDCCDSSLSSMIIRILSPGFVGDVTDSAGLTDYHRHHCGYLVSIGFPPSRTGGSMVTCYGSALSGQLA